MTVRAKGESSGNCQTHYGRRAEWTACLGRVRSERGRYGLGLSDDVGLSQFDSIARPNEPRTASTSRGGVLGTVMGTPYGCPPSRSLSLLRFSELAVAAAVPTGSTVPWLREVAVGPRSGSSHLSHRTYGSMEVRGRGI